MLNSDAHWKTSSFDTNLDDCCYGDLPLTYSTGPDGNRMD